MEKFLLSAAVFIALTYVADTIFQNGLFYDNVLRIAKTILWHFGL